MIRCVEKKMAERVMCPHCLRTFEYEDSDLEDFGRGTGFVCPKCKEWIQIGEEVKPFTFPDSFFHYSVSNDANPISDKDTQKYIDDVVSRKSIMDTGDYTCIATGDTMVIGFKHENNFTVVVAKNYWEDEIEL